MSTKPSSTKSSNTEDARHCNNVIISKLRRLKIEEKLLLQSLQKLDQKRNYEVPESEISMNMDFRNMMKKLKDSYININNLFDEVKTVTRNQDLLAEIDIEDIKKKVLELETTLKSFKVYLNAEISSLKVSEQELIKQMEDIKLKEFNIYKKRTKIPSANYNQVVPSPVRLQMTSPFKCIQVQEFQDFMKNSPNRYGGWNEYHHNIFVKYWQKHFGNFAIHNNGNNSIAENLAFENFVEEALFNLQGVRKESLMSHVEWYKKYLFLKHEQQCAIDKWKTNRRSIRKIPEKVIMRNSEKEEGTNDQLSTEDTIYEYNQMACDFVDASKEIHTSNIRKPESLKPKKNFIKKETKPKHKARIGQDAIERHTKPTKQWLSRNYNDTQKIQQINFIENMEKLRIPSWRQYLEK